MFQNRSNLVILVLLIVIGFLLFFVKNNQPSVEIEKGLGTKNLHSDSWQKLECVPRNKISCQGGECEKIKPTVWLEIDRVNKTFSRCDAKGCDDYLADFATSGVFTNIQPKLPIGTMIKIFGEGNYLEIATIGLTSLISDGICYRK